MTEVNIPLLRKAVEWVEYQDSLPEIDREWHQGAYVLSPLNRASAMLDQIRCGWTDTKAEQVAAHCGTAYCVAGYIGQMLDEHYAFSQEPAGMPHIGDFAQAALGLTTDQADQLFEGINDAATIRALAEKFAGQPL